MPPSSPLAAIQSPMSDGRIGVGCHGIFLMILLYSYGANELLLRLTNSGRGLQPWPSSLRISLTVHMFFFAHSFKVVFGHVPHCMSISFVRNRFPKSGCLVISSQEVGSCCSSPGCIVLHALRTPCHMDDPCNCLTIFFEFITQLGCEGRFPQRACLV